MWNDGFLTYGYATTDVRYCWKNKGNNYRKSLNEDLTEEIELPQFDIISFKLKQFTRILSSGSYAQLHIYFVLRRNIGFYIIQIYLPSTLIVVISWVSFWLSRDATPARVALGVTTVLTMTTLMTTTNSAMPKVSYIKAIDVYLSVSFAMVFASLLEYAAVGYLNKKLKMRRERQMQKINAASKPTFQPSQKENTERKVSAFISKAISQASNHGTKHLHMSPVAPTGVQLSSSYLQGGVECDCDIEMAAHHTAHPLKVMKPKRTRSSRMLTPSTIDKYSRIIFPLLYGLFNALYWALLYRAAGKLVQKYSTPFKRINGSTPETDTCFLDESIYTGVFVP